MGVEQGSVDVTEEELRAARAYPMEIIWSARDNAFLASFPDVPGVVTHGATREEAAAMGDELIVAWYTALHDAGRFLPRPPVSIRDVDVHSPASGGAELVRGIRAELAVSQHVFAALLNVSVATIRSWEQGWRAPEGAALRLLEIAKRRPGVILEAMSQTVATSPKETEIRSA